MLEKGTEEANALHNLVFSTSSSSISGGCEQESRATSADCPRHVAVHGRFWLHQENPDTLSLP